MKIRKFVAPLVFASLTLAACGGDDGNVLSQAAGGNNSSTTAAAGNSSSSSSASSASSGSTTTAKGSSTTLAADLFGGKCADALKAYSAAFAGAGGIVSGASADYEAAIKAIQTYADSAPAAIKADFKVFATGMAAFLKALKDAGVNPGTPIGTNPAALAAFANAAKELDKPEFKAAADRVSAWFQTNCKS